MISKVKVKSPTDCHILKDAKFVLRIWCRARESLGDLTAQVQPRTLSISGMDLPMTQNAATKCRDFCLSQIEPKSVEIKLNHSQIFCRVLVFDLGDMMCRVPL